MIYVSLPFEMTMEEAEQTVKIFTEQMLQFLEQFEDAEENDEKEDGILVLPFSSPEWFNDLIQIYGMLSDNKDITSPMGNSGETPLHHAAAIGPTKLCRILVKRGADVNAQDKHGYPPLYRAAFNMRMETSKFLSSQGANPYLKNNCGHSTADHLIKSKNDKFQELYFIIQQEYSAYLSAKTIQLENERDKYKALWEAHCEAEPGGSAWIHAKDHWNCSKPRRNSI